MGSPRCPGEREEIKGGADHCPLTSDLFQSAETELAETSGMLDLAEDRLGDLLAQTVSTAVPGAFELGHHGGDARPATPPFTAAVWFAAPSPARRDISLDRRFIPGRRRIFRYLIFDLLNLARGIPARSALGSGSSISTSVMSRAPLWKVT
jgi:hypothetical protein